MLEHPVGHHPARRRPWVAPVAWSAGNGLVVLGALSSRPPVADARGVLLLGGLVLAAIETRHATRRRRRDAADPGSVIISAWPAPGRRGRPAHRGLAPMGTAHQVRRQEELLATTDPPLFPWHTGPKPRFVRIEPTSITGRRFHAVDHHTWDDPLTGSHHTSPERDGARRPTSIRYWPYQVLSSGPPPVPDARHGPVATASRHPTRRTR